MAQSKKFSPLRFTGASEEAALQGALQQADVSRDDVDYEVLSQDAKGVTVRIRMRADAPLESPSPAPEPELRPIVDEMPSLEAMSPVVEEVALAAILEDEADPEEALFESESEADLDLDLDLDSTESSSEAVSTSSEERPRKSERNGYNRQLSAKARAQAQEFLTRMGLEAEARFGRGFNESTIPLFVDGPDVGILIGKHGATLQSFQYLLNLTVNNVDGLGGDPEGGVRITVDAGKYRQRRTTSLEASARQAANKARREGRPIRLEPMPAHERRIVHLYLQTVAEVSSVSEGKEPTRRIVVTPSNTVPNPNFRPVLPARPSNGNRSGAGGGMGSFSRGRRPDGRSGGSASGGGYSRGR